MGKSATGDGEEYKSEVLEKLCKKVSGSENLTVKFEILKSDVPAIINLSEQSRRFSDMMKFYSMSSGEKFDGLDEDITLVLNSANPVVRKLGERADDAGESF